MVTKGVPEAKERESKKGKSQEQGAEALVLRDPRPDGDGAQLPRQEVAPVPEGDRPMRRRHPRFQGPRWFFFGGDAC